MAKNYEDVEVVVCGAVCTAYRCERCHVDYPQPTMAELCCLTRTEAAESIKDYGVETYTGVLNKALIYRNGL